VSEHPPREQGPVSVDGARYAIVDGEWSRVGFFDSPKDPDARPFSLPDGHVSVDGAVYAIIDGEWTRAGFSGSRKDLDATPFSLPEGHVSVDGACGVRKPSSRGSAVFVDESAESVSALDEGCRRARDLQLPTRGIGRLQIE
jgi:hypothetical protein